MIVGTMFEDELNKIMEILKEYFDRPDCYFVVSTDLCHWGKKYNFEHFPNNNNNMEIYEFIEKIDENAMQIIEEGFPVRFSDYCRSNKNNICGKSAILLMMSVLYIH